MQDTISAFLQALILVSALSADTFIASLACGTGNIKIPFSSLILICLICSTILSVSMAFGILIQPFLQPWFAKGAAFCVLAGLGLYYILHPPGPVDGDKDHSKSLSLKESFFFSLALSLDGIPAGAGAGLLHGSLLFACLLSLVFTGAAVKAGICLGGRISAACPDPSLIGGLLLIILALLQLC